MGGKKDYMGGYKKMSHLRDSNPRPAIYETAALPTELRWLEFYSTKNTIFVSHLEVSFSLAGPAMYCSIDGIFSFSLFSERY
jgi:hypothetical protein